MDFENLKINNNEILEGPLLISPRIFHDKRGYFYESWNNKAFCEILKKDVSFVQDNHSRSLKGVLRGLHYQLPPSQQGKLIRCTKGRIFDVAVNLKKNSSQYKKWIGLELNDYENKQLWIPEGFAHGFLSLTEDSEIQYKTTQYWNNENERSILWNDPELEIKWPIELLDNTEIITSNNDKNGLTIQLAEKRGEVF